MARRVAFSEDGAKRIVAATRAYERGNRDQPPIKFRQVGDDGELLRIGRLITAWPKDTTESVELIYETSCEDEGSGSGTETLEAWNRLFDIQSGALVYLAATANGCWNVVAVSTDCDGGSGSDGSGSGGCCLTLGGQDLTTVEGYDAAGVQLLGHDNGCLRWFDTTDCGSGS